MGEVSKDLFEKWVNNLPDNSQTEESLNDLAKNASEATIFVIKSFMEKISDVATEIKPNN